MWEWLNNNSDAIKAVGGIVSGLGSAYSAVTQNNIAKQMYNLEKDAYTRSVKKDEEAQYNLNQAVKNVYGTTPSFTL